MQLNAKARKAPKTAPVATATDTVTEALAAAGAVTLPATTEAPVTEAPAKPSAADKRAAYVADAASAKAIFAALSSAVSIPVKPGAFKAKPLNPKAYSLSERGAAAIYVAVAASGKAFSDGETYSRAFTIGGKSYTIENGAFSDFIGTAYDVAPGQPHGAESFTLRPGAVAAIRAKLGAKISAFTL